MSTGSQTYSNGVVARIAAAVAALVFAVLGAAASDSIPVLLPDTIPLGAPVPEHSVVIESELLSRGDSVTVTPIEEIGIATPDATAQMMPEGVAKTFNPSPTRAVWLSALFPGLGQVYNRRYWKLPIVAGAFMGIGYGLSWNNTMLGDYTRAYNDITDNDPDTKGYMDLFPPTVTEESLDKTWLTKTLKNNKDYCRRNRDLCIIAMVGVYLVAMVDAYVDASLAHFDISPDLAVRWSPSVIQDSRSPLPSVGVQWALVF